MTETEQLRIYTADGEPTPIFKARAEVHRDGDWHGTVHLWILNSSNKLLFQKRCARAELHPGLWDVSVAGHVVGEDSLIQTLEREAFEELGISLSLAAAKPLFTLRTEFHSSVLHERVFQHVYLVNREIKDHELRLQASEVAAIQWHDYSLLAQLATETGGFVPRQEEFAKLYGIISQLR